MKKIAYLVVALLVASVSCSRAADPNVGAIAAKSMASRFLGINVDEFDQKSARTMVDICHFLKEIGDAELSEGTGVMLIRREGIATGFIVDFFVETGGYQAICRVLLLPEGAEWRVEDCSVVFNALR